MLDNIPEKINGQYDPYELMVTRPDVKSLLIMKEMLIKEDDMKSIKTLIDLGANVNYVNENSLSILHYACF